MTVFVVIDGDRPGSVKEVCRINDIVNIVEEVKGSKKDLVFTTDTQKVFRHSLTDFSFIIGKEKFVERPKVEEQFNGTIGEDTVGGSK